MSNTTPIYWEARGVSLHTHAWSLRTFGGGRYSSVAKRGEDLVLPFREGRIRQRKQREGRTLPLEMWVLPRNPDGTRDVTKTPEQKMHENWLYLIDLLDTEAQFTLTKRWYAQDGSVKVASAQAELLDALSPVVSGGARLEFTAEVFLADPYFYGTEQSAAVGALTVVGDVPTERVRLTMGPGRVDFPDGNWIEYTGTGTVVIDGKAGTAKKGSQYVNGQINRNRLFPEWMVLTPGAQTLTGSGTIAYDPAYR